MLDIGKLILCLTLVGITHGFSSMLDIGKLIQRKNMARIRLSFSSMLDIGKLIRNGLTQAEMQAF